MEWINIKEKLPPNDAHRTIPYVLALHSRHGVGVAWFWRYDEGDGIIEELEEESMDKYICSAHFIKPELDGNYCIDDEDNIDIFENSPHFKNLGTITHWMPLPKHPKD